MLQRRRKRKTDPAIAALARELLEAGEALRHSILPLFVEEARLFEARVAAAEVSYLVGVAYCDAIAARRASLAEAVRAGSGARYATALARADKFGWIADTAGAVLLVAAGA